MVTQMRASEARVILTGWGLRPNNRECALYASHSVQAGHALSRSEWFPLRKTYGLHNVRAPQSPRSSRYEASWDFQDGPGGPPQTW